MAVTQFEVVSTDEPYGIRLIGEVDLATAPQLETALNGLTDGNGNGVSLDLAELTFIDSAGLAVIVQYAESIKGKGPVLLANAPRQIVRVLEIIGLREHPLFEITYRDG